MKTTETFRRFVRLLITAILIPAAALATDCRFTLVDQSNWYANTGFYMDLENSPAGSSTYCQLANMTIAVGVADGAQWRFIVQRPSWKTNHTYTAEAVITPTYFELYLDGQFLWQVFGGFSSLPNQDLLVNAVPSWADGPATISLRKARSMRNRAAESRHRARSRPTRGWFLLCYSRRGPTP